MAPWPWSLSASGRGRPCTAPSDASPVATSADKRNFWRRAEAARQARLISYGAFAYLGTLARLAGVRGDGESFVLGERIIEAVTQTNRASAQRWRYQLTTAGLIDFQRQWAHKRGWFWEAKTTLLFCGPTGPKMRPEASGLISRPDTGPKKRPSLNGSPSHQNGTEAGDGSGLRPAERRAVTRPKAVPGESTARRQEGRDAASAATSAGGASGVGSTPTPTAGDQPSRPDDAKGAPPAATPPDPKRIIPDAEAARRIRELIASLRFKT